MATYKASTYVKPSTSKMLLQFPNNPNLKLVATKPIIPEPSLYLTTVIKSHTDPSSKYKYKQKHFEQTLMVNPPSLSKSEYDAKIKKSSQQLQNMYNKVMKAKRSTKLIAIEDRPQIIMTIKEPVEKKEKKKKQSNNPKIICMSTLKSGKPCTAPAKNGSKFCGRHGAL